MYLSIYLIHSVKRSQSILLILLHSFNFVVVKSFVKNMLTTKLSDCKSDLVKEHASRPYTSTGKGMFQPMCVSQHSEELGKLYVRLGAACPFVYRTSRTSPPPRGSVLRVLPVYIRPEHVRDVVRRCPNHVAGAVRDATAAGLSPGEADAQAQHLIRSQHAHARYLENPSTRRLSVLVPFEPPQGQYPAIS